MAQVRIRRREVEDGLPSVCMVCGDDASFDVRRTFRWHPQWVALLILLGLLPYVLVALMLTQRMTVDVPLCTKHRGHWTWRNWVSYGGLALCLVLGFLAILLIGILDDRRGRGAPEAAGFLCAGVGFLGLVWLITVVVIQQIGIRATEITDRDITLTNVSADFEDALLDEQDRDDGRPRRDRR